MRKLLHLAAYLLFVLPLAALFANVEIQVEGASGWAGSLSDPPSPTPAAPPDPRHPSAERRGSAAVPAEYAAAVPVSVVNSLPGSCHAPVLPGTMPRARKGETP